MYEQQNETETEIVEDANLQPTTAPRRGPISIGGRAVMMKAITENSDRIVAAGGSVLLTARQVLDALKSEKLLPALFIGEIKSANGVGDALGYKHLALPCILRGTKREYLIPAVQWTADEKKVFNEKTEEEQLSIIYAMMEEFSAEMNA